MAQSYIKHSKIDLKTHPSFNEKWVQGIIANDPTILGLGDLILKDMERIQPGAGRYGCPGCGAVWGDHPA